MVTPNKLRMIDIGIRICLIFLLILIFFQDVKDRLVYWFLYPLVGLLAYIINSREIGIWPSITNAAFNLLLTVFVLGCSYTYVAVVKKRKFLNESIGAGDVLFFICLPFTFAPIAFIILFIFSLIFSLLLHLIFKAGQADKTVPLAGYMALFFAAVYTVSFFTEPRYLFSY